MASPTESRRGTVQRRDSSRSSSRRPRLLRSSATEPSITPSTASRNALATPGTSRRATDLLNQVAVSSSPPNSSSPLSQSPTMYDSPARIARDHVDLDGFRPHLGMSSSHPRSWCFNVICADSGGFHSRLWTLFQFPELRHLAARPPGGGAGASDADADADAIPLSPSRAATVLGFLDGTAMATTRIMNSGTPVLLKTA